MTLTAEPTPDAAPLPRDVLELVRERRAVVDDAEVDILELALEWAHSHPVLPGEEGWRPTPVDLHPPDLSDLAPSVLDTLTEDDILWAGIPSVAWDAPAAFAAANGMTTAAGKALMRDVLVLANRAPRTWGLLTHPVRSKRRGTAKQARRVADGLLSQPDDVCAYVDRAVSRRIARGDSVGAVVLDRLIDEAMLRLHAEEREFAQLEALDRRHVTVDPASINHTGVGALDARAEWADLAAFDETVGALAAAIKDHPDFPEAHYASLDIRRSIALGIMADPARALGLLHDNNDPGATRVRDLNAVFQLTEPSVLGLDPVAVDTDGVAWLDDIIRRWSGRPDMRLVVRPIRHCGGAAGGCTGPDGTGCPGEIDCADHGRLQTHKYTPSTKDREIVALRDRTCVHPHCRRKARRCDCDHITPFDPHEPDSGGPTCPKCNLAPLCRHHHRLKTHAGWRYWMITPGTYLWSDPHGLLYLRTPDGTRALD